jgi:pimeloyl-ACP methyl ester carboxylesterase
MSLRPWFAVLLVGVMGCPAKPEPVVPRRRVAKRLTPPRRVVERTEPARPTEPPATYKEYFTVYRGAKQMGRAYLGFEKNEQGALFELRYASATPWFRVTQHVKVQTDAAYVPQSLWALEMEQTVGTTLRLYTQYDVKITAAAAQVATTQFGYRWTKRYTVAQTVPLARYPLLAAYLLARRHAEGKGGTTSYAALDPTNGKIRPLKVTVRRTGDRAQVALAFAGGTLDVDYDAAWAKLRGARGGKGGLSYRPGGKPPGLVPPPASFKRARKVKPFAWPARFKTVPFSARSTGGLVIRGLLSLPAGARKNKKLAVIVLVPSANTIDWDGTRGMKKIYAELAAFLNGAGHAVLRFAPRGVAPTGATGKVTLASYQKDLRAILKGLRKSRYLARGRVLLLGHAEGGLVAAHFAARRGGELRGLMLVSTPGVPYLDYVVDQWRRRWETVGMGVPEVKSRLAYLRGLIQTATTTPGGTFYGRPGTLMADLIKLNPLRAFRKVKIPTLLLAGQADVTVRGDDLNALRAGMPANRKITVARPNNVGHLLQYSPRYLEVSEMWRIPSPLAKGARKALRDWLKKTLKK